MAVQACCCTRRVAARAAPSLVNQSPETATRIPSGRQGATMKFVIETNLASKRAWWLVDDDNRVVA